jgi:hypothetical protein
VGGDGDEARGDLPYVQVVDLDDAGHGCERAADLVGVQAGGAASSRTRVDACSSDQPERSMSAATVRAARASTSAGPPNAMTAPAVTAAAEP